MRLPLGIKMDPNRVISTCLVLYLSFTSCLSATQNPQTTRNLNLNSQDPLKTSDEKATTSKTGVDQDTTRFKLGFSAEAPPKLKYGLKTDPSTDLPPKDLGFRIPVSGEPRLEIKSNAEKIGVTSIDIDVGSIRKNEMKPTSATPVVFDPFHLIQAEQNMMKKKLAQLPLVHMNKDETSNSEGTPLSTQYSTTNTVKVSDEKVSEAPYGFLSLYESKPQRKINKEENADKLSHPLHDLGLFGNSSKIFVSSQSMLSQRSKLQASEELKVDLTTSAFESTVSSNFKPLEPNFATSQIYFSGQKDTTSEKLQARSGIVEESTHESLGISQNPTQLPLAESTTNGIQLKLIPSEKRNKDALTLGEKRDKVKVSNSLLSGFDSAQFKSQKMVETVSQVEQSPHKQASGMEMSGKGLENTILLKIDDSGAKFRSVFQPKTDEPMLSTEIINALTTAFESGKKEAIDAGGMIPKGTIVAFMNSSSDKISFEKVGDSREKLSSRDGLETKTVERKTEDIIGKNRGEISRSKFEDDVTKSIPVLSVVSSISSPSSDIKYRGNVKASDMKMNANTKYTSKGQMEAIESGFLTKAPTIDPAVSVGPFINTQLKGIQNIKAKIDVDIATKKPAAKGELEVRGDDGLKVGQISANKVEDVTRYTKGFTSSARVSTHFPDIYYRTDVKVIDSKINKELRKDVDIGSKKLEQTAGNKLEGITILNAPTGISVSTLQPYVKYNANEKNDFQKPKEERVINSGFNLLSRKSSGGKIEEVTKINPPVSEALVSTSFPNIQYKHNDKVDVKMNVDSDFSSKGKLKAGDNRFRLGQIPESKVGNVILTTSVSPSGSDKPKGVLVQQPKVFQQREI